MSLVLDSSVLVEVVLGTSKGGRARPLLLSHSGQLHIPELAVVEVTSALRGLVQGEVVTKGRAKLALDDFLRFPAKRWPMDQLMERVWTLRDTLTAYDATFIALAEALGSVFVTFDERLARGCEGKARCRVQLITFRED
ncbi:MAG: type II toxin-antitoxin system VapC family toxin [Propionibacteriaceae bacterium]|nr:type II toxin-antitoxin system VapC family toxin [Propionibacteriaceae bacterium]